MRLTDLRQLAAIGAWKDRASRASAEEQTTTKPGATCYICGTEMAGSEGQTGRCVRCIRADLPAQMMPRVIRRALPKANTNLNRRANRKARARFIRAVVRYGAKSR